MTLLVTETQIKHDTKEIWIWGEKTTYYLDMERRRYCEDDRYRLVGFCFDMTDKAQWSYIKNWLHRQKATSEAKTYGEALNSIIGTYTDISSLYLVIDDIWD